MTSRSRRPATITSGLGLGGRATITALAARDRRTQTVTETFTSEPIPIPPQAREGRFERADIVLEWIEQTGPSFDGHLFLKNPAANRDTGRGPASGYAGAFHVYGQGPVAARDEAGGVRAPITKQVIATDAVRAAARDAAELTVTVVPIARGAGDPAPLELDRVSIVFT
jgi:hypothetical protein